MLSFKKNFKSMGQMGSTQGAEGAGGSAHGATFHHLPAVLAHQGMEVHCDTAVRGAGRRIRGTLGLSA